MHCVIVETSKNMKKKAKIHKNSKKRAKSKIGILKKGQNIEKLDKKFKISIVALFFSFF